MVKKKRKMVFIIIYTASIFARVGLSRKTGASGLMMPFRANKTCDIAL
jgi:hypothetical protein